MYSIIPLCQVECGLSGNKTLFGGCEKNEHNRVQSWRQFLCKLGMSNLCPMWVILAQNGTNPEFAKPKYTEIRSKKKSRICPILGAI